MSLRRTKSTIISWAGSFILIRALWACKLRLLKLTFLRQNEVRIENYVTKVTVRLHEARRVMPNSYLSDRFFFLAYSSFKLEYELLYQFLRWNNYFFDQEAPIYDVYVKHPRVRRKYPERVKIAENLVRYARKKKKGSGRDQLRKGVQNVNLLVCRPLSQLSNSNIFNLPE